MKQDKKPAKTIDTNFSVSFRIFTDSNSFGAFQAINQTFSDGQISLNTFLDRSRYVSQLRPGGGPSTPGEDGGGMCLRPLCLHGWSTSGFGERKAFGGKRFHCSQGKTDNPSLPMVRP